MISIESFKLNLSQAFINFVTSWSRVTSGTHIARHARFSSLAFQARRSRGTNIAWNSLQPRESSFTSSTRQPSKPCRSFYSSLSPGAVTAWMTILSSYSCLTRRTSWTGRTRATAAGSLSLDLFYPCFYNNLRGKYKQSFYRAQSSLIPSQEFALHYQGRGSNQLQRLVSNLFEIEYYLLGLTGYH